MYDPKVALPGKMEIDEEYDRLISPIMTACRIFSCWPNRAEVEGSKTFSIRLLRFRRRITAVLLIILLFGSVNEAVHYWGIDMNETIECSLVSTAITLAVVRVLVFSSRQRDMLYVVEMMRRDWARANEKERKILRDQCLQAFKLSKLFILSVSLASGGFIVLPIIEVFTLMQKL